MVSRELCGDIPLIPGSRASWSLLVIFKRRYKLQQLWKQFIWHLLFVVNYKIFSLYSEIYAIVRLNIVTDNFYRLYLLSFQKIFFLRTCLYTYLYFITVKTEKSNTDVYLFHILVTSLILESCKFQLAIKLVIFIPDW